ncbi:MAG TPA: transglutaminase family protein [Armatimonadota bacterium]|nr:transglutaminase family protein [Armatimonadota bacterium]
MFFQVRHTTRFDYSRPVLLEPHTVRLRPRSDAAQRLHRFDLTADPAAAGRSDLVDLDGNSPVHLWFTGLTEGLSLTTTFLVETLRANPFDFLVDPPHLQLPLQYPEHLSASLRPYLDDAPPADPVADLSRDVLRDAGGEMVPFLGLLNSRVWDLSEKIIREEGDPLPAAETLAHGRGSCRDLTVLYMEACRAVGIAARFVSGYQEGVAEQRQRDLHAWAEVYVPGGGWRGYDPTLGLAVADRHVALAAGPTSKGAAPVTGSFRGTGATSTLHAEIELLVTESPPEGE